LARVSRLLCLTALLALLGALATPAPLALAVPLTLTVNSAGDEPDASTADNRCDVDLVAAGDQCTLRAAIQQINVQPAGDVHRINFNIPQSPVASGGSEGYEPAGYWRIRPASPLPAVTAGNVTIDGTTQPFGSGAAAGWSHPRIVLDGSLLTTSGANGLTITSAGNVVRRLTILNFAQGSAAPGLAGNGIFINGSAASGNRVHGCYLGTSPDGSIAAANTTSGVQVNGAANNIVGHPTVGTGPDIGTAGDTALGNLVAGNGRASGTSANIYLINTGGDYAAGRGNVVRANLVGTNLAGNAEIGGAGNPSSGIILQRYLDDTIVEENVVSGHDASATRYGIYIFGSDPLGSDSPTDTRVSGNVIGTTRGATTTIRVPNGVGIYLAGGTNTLIGGATPAARNIISGNGAVAGNGHGIQIRTSAVFNTTVQGNYIGLNASGESFGRSGASSNGNLGAGVLVENNARQTTIRDNVVSNNYASGIILGSDGHVVAGNRIGVNTALQPVSDDNFANGQAGVWINGSTGDISPLPQPAAGNLIGGNNPGDANIIAYGLDATAAAVLIQPSLSGTSQNRVIGNYIGVASNGQGLRASPATGSSGVYIIASAAARRTDNNQVISNTIGGLGTGVRIESTFTTGNQVSANVIGTTGAGNRQFGVWLLQGTTGNTIGGSGGVGVNDTRNVLSNNAIQGILVGVNANGNTLLRNLSRDNGGASGHGVQVDATVSQVRISGTETGTNGGKGINRSGSAPAPPAISGITAGSPPTLQVQAPAGANCGAGGCRIEVFTSPTRDDAEGPRYLAFQDGIAAGATASIPVPNCDRFFSATITDQSNNTSEFTPTMFEAPFSCQTDFTLAQTGRVPPGVGPVDAGTNVIYTYTVTNNGGSPITLAISRNDPSGWASPPSQSSIVLAAGASDTFNITVAVPANALAGDYTFSVTAQVGATQRTVNTTTTVARRYGVTVTPDSRTDSFTRPGTVDFVHTMTNTGNGTDTIAISVVVTPNDGATATVVEGETCASLAAFTSCTRTIRLTIPAGPGASLYTVTITAASTGSPGVQAVAVDTASAGAAPQITPPSQLKEGLPGATVPFSHTVTNIGQSTGRFTPTLSLSQGPPWTFNLVDAAPFDLNPAQSRVVSLTVTVPNSPIPDAGTLVTATLTVQATGGSSASATSTTRVGLVPGFTFSEASVPALNLPPGATAIFTHTLTNTGNGPDDFRVTAVLPGGLENLTIAPAGVFRLARGASQQVVVRARVRDGQGAGPQAFIVTGVREGDPSSAQPQTDTVTVLSAPGVRLSPGQTLNVTPPGSVTFSHTLTNVGNVAGNFAVSATGLPPGWNITGPQNLSPASCLQNLASGATCAFDLVVTTPAQLPQVPAGAYSFQVQASTTGASDAVTDVVNVLPVPRFDFARNENGSGAPDALLTFTHRITNTGNIADNYTFSVQPGAGGFTALPPASLTQVPPGEGRAVIFNVRLPATAPAGTTGVVTLTATSALGAPTRSVSDTLTVIGADNARLEPAGTTQQTVFTGGTPATAIYTLNLFNSGNTTISYTLRLNPASLTGGWTASVTPTLTAVLPPSITQPIPVTVRVDVPTDAVGVQAVTVEVLRGDGAGPLLATATLTTTAELAAAGGLLTPDENRGSGLPGETVIYTHTLRNIRSVPDTFVFSALVPLGYRVAIPPGVFLQPNETRIVAVSITLPTGVLSGTVDAMRLSVQSATDPAVAADAREYTTVRQVVNAVISPEYARTVEAGDSLELNHQLLNTGNFTDTFILTFTQTQNWDVTLQPPQRRLKPNEQAPGITLTMSVPTTAPPGSVNRIRVRAQSQSDPAKIFEVENVLIIPAALPRVTYVVNLPLVQR